MNDNFLNDNELDQWLRKNAGTRKEAPAADGWDSPSEGVWTGLRNGLDQRKKRRRGFLFFSMILALVMIGGGLGYWYNLEGKTELSQESNIVAWTKNSSAGVPLSKSRPADIKKTAKQQTIVSSPESDINTQTLNPGRQPAPKQINQAKVALSAPQAPDKPQLNHSLKKDNAVNHEPLVQPRATNKPDLAQSFAPESLLLPLTSAVPLIDSPMRASLSLKPIDAKARAFGPLERLPLVIPKPINSQPKVNWPEIKPPKPTKNIRVYAGMVSGAYYTSRHLKNKNGNSPNGQESGAWTWQSGAVLGFQLNEHWAIETGLQVSSIRLQAERSVDFRYNSNQEQFNQQNFLYTNSDQQTIETSFGEIEMRMNIGREPNRPITDQAIVQLILRTDEQAKYLRTPLLLHWQQSTGRLQWGLTGGLGINFEAGYALQLTAARTDRPGVRNINARIQKRANGLAPVMFDAQIGAKIQYQLTPCWSLRVAPEFRYGLSSMYRNGPFRSLAFSGGVQAGLIMQFGK